MTNLFNNGKKRDQIFAIDMGTRTTKAVLFDRKDDGLSLSRFTVQDAPIYDKALPQGLLTEHLKAVVAAMQPKTRQVTLAIGANDSVLRTTEFPLMPAAEMRQMLKFNSKTYLQQDLRDHVFDCFIVPPPGKPQQGEPPKAGVTKYKVWVGGTRRELLVTVEAAVKSRGVDPKSSYLDAAWSDQCPRILAAGTVRQGNGRAGRFGIQDFQHQHPGGGRIVLEPLGRVGWGPAYRRIVRGDEHHLRRS